MRKFVLALLLIPAVARGAVTYVSNGTGCAVTATTCSPSVPASTAAEDVLLAVCHSRTNTAHTCSANCSGVGKDSTSWTVLGTQGGATTGGRVSVWWLRLGGALGTGPTFGGPATESYACQIHRFTGVIRTGNPYDVTAAQVANASSTTFTGSSVTSTVNDVMVVFAGGSMDDNQWGTPGGGVDSLGGYTQNTNGTDNSVFLAYDNAPSNTPGARTAPTLVQSLNGPDAGRSQTFALTPDVINTGTIARDSGSSYPVVASQNTGTVSSVATATMSTSAATTLMVCAVGMANGNPTAWAPPTVAWTSANGSCTSFTSQSSQTHASGSAHHCSVWTSSCTSTFSSIGVTVTPSASSANAVLTVACDALRNASTSMGVTAGTTWSASRAVSISVAGRTANSWVYVSAGTEGASSVAPLTYTDETADASNSTHPTDGSTGVDVTGRSGTFTVGWGTTAGYGTVCALEILEAGGGAFTPANSGMAGFTVESQ